MNSLETAIKAVSRVVEAEEWGAVKALFPMILEELAKEKDEQTKKAIHCGELEAGAEQAELEIGKLKGRIAGLEAHKAAGQNNSDHQTNGAQAVPSSGDSVPV